MDDENPILRARRIAGAPGKPLSQEALASLLGYSQPGILYAQRAGRVSPQLAMAIEAKVGIPRHELRPDMWQPPAEASAA